MSGITYGTANLKSVLTVATQVVNDFISLGKITIVSVAWVLIKRLKTIADVFKVIHEVKNEILDLSAEEKEDLKTQIMKEIDSSTYGAKIAESILVVIVDMSSIFNLIALIKDRNYEVSILLKKITN